jgi:hypothetical protein
MKITESLGKFGVEDILPCEFDYIRVWKTTIIARKNNKYSVYNKQGQELISNCDYVEVLNKHFVYVRIDKEYKLVRI